MHTTARFAAALLAACLAVAPAAAAAAAKKAAPACVKGADEVALQVRVVQTDLMVAALSCSASARYNEFVKANQPVLMAAHTQLTGFFNKKRGGASALNAFITKLANDSSMRSVQDIATFCQETGWLYDAILNPQRGDLPTFIGPLLIAQRHGFTPCEARATYVVLGPNGPTQVAAATPPAAPAATPPGAPAPAPADAGGVPTPQPKPAAIASR
jgi:hypothetical protein